MVTIPSNTAELESRKAAMRAAWASQHDFWSSNAPWKLKRTVFLSRIYGAALSGNEAYVYSDSDWSMLEALVNKWLRVLKGGASWQGTTHMRCRSTKELLTFWRLPPLRVEARVRRIKFQQKMVSHQSGYLQAIGAILGDINDEKVLDASGVVLPTANRWAKQWDRDLRDCSMYWTKNGLDPCSTFSVRELRISSWPTQPFSGDVV